MYPRTIIPSSLSLALLLAGLLLAGIVLPMHIVASPQLEDFTCSPYHGDWDEATATCIVEDFQTIGWGLDVPPTMTLVVSGTFLNEPDIVGPGAGVLVIDDITVDGHLVIANQAMNYGRVFVNGRLTISGTWTNAAENRYACGSHGCVDSYVEGILTNRGAWISTGHLAMPYGAVNEGDWLNSGTVDAGDMLVNRGQITNTGTVTTAGTTMNMGLIHSPGLLVNQGTIYNMGLLSGTIANEGVIYSMGVLSGTIEGDGPVYPLHERAYLPQISK